MLSLLDRQRVVSASAIILIALAGFCISSVDGFVSTTPSGIASKRTRPFLFSRTVGVHGGTGKSSTPFRSIVSRHQERRIKIITGSELSLSKDIDLATASDTEFYDDTSNNSSSSLFTIRPCGYSDLTEVADLIIDGFYPKSTGLQFLYRLAELNRLQQNFPYADADLHQMFVAVADTNLDMPNNESGSTGQKKQRRTIVGFCDVDCRPCKTKPPLPRPYLSDLTVLSDFRRRGIARSLILHCEKFVQGISKKDELFIRVETNNTAALAMYNGLDYETLEEVTDHIAKYQVFVLRKMFGQKSAQE